jgi:tetratricopeptide (TPR) repeat protein
MGKRKQKNVGGDHVGNVVKFRTRAQREAEQAVARSAEADAGVAFALAPVIEFPIDRVKPRGPIFNLSYREGSNGQRSLDFDGFDRPKTPCEVVRLRPVDSAHQAYTLYMRAGLIDEDPATYDEAATLYEKALWLDPSLAIAEVNLANIRFRRGDAKSAEAMYRHAIGVQHHCPEAHYNLGYVMLEHGNAQAAADSFKTAIEQDPRFADAHFNLAMAYEQMGKRAVAKNHWHMYLDIEPRGVWADIARKHII